MEDPYKQDKYRFDVIESLLKQGVPMGTIFDMIIQNPSKYCYPKQAKYIKDNREEYEEQVTRLRLKEGYMSHLEGPMTMKFLFMMGFPENIITKYILYPQTYQFRTHLPFLDTIKTIAKFPKSPYYPSSIIEDLLGVVKVDRKKSSIHVVRYAYEPEGGTEFAKETTEEICGTFYYPEPNSDVILKFNSCFIVPNKILAYRYFTDTSLEDIARDMVGREDAFETYLLGPSMLKSEGSGFNTYYIDYDEVDIKNTYKIMKDSLTNTFETLVSMMGNIISVSRYFEDLEKSQEADSIVYKYQGAVQYQDLIVFLVSYTRYRAIRMMFLGTWNWRINIFLPYSYYDQIICNRAREENIDLIILTTESSSGMITRIRTEILDTRPRDISLDNLYMKKSNDVLRRLEMERREYDEIMGI